MQSKVNAAACEYISHNGELEFDPDIIKAFEAGSDWFEENLLPARNAQYAISILEKIRDNLSNMFMNKSSKFIEDEILKLKKQYNG